MKKTVRGQPAFEGWPIILLLVVTALGGGTARMDVMSLLYVHPIAGIVATLVLARRWQVVNGTIVPLTLLSLLAGLIVLQLVPLPPSATIHSAFGALIAQGDRLVFGNRIWRPLSIAPDFTLQSLVSLIVPFAALVGTITSRRSIQKQVLVVLIVLAGTSASLGILQLIFGDAFQLYANRSEGAPNGLFSNRNHQAVFLAISLPMIATWLAPRARGIGWHLFVGLGVATLLLTVIVLTGSRAGLVFGLICFVVAGWILRDAALELIVQRWGLPRRMVQAMASVAIAALAAGIAALGRTEAFSRLAGFDPRAEGRARALPVLMRLLKQAQPFGTGFGTFDPAYRIIEPDSLLKPTYLNHAHNELLEIGITGGVAGLALMIWLLGWILHRLVQTDWRAGTDHDGLPLLGGVMVLVLAVASLFDYPLRTPFLMVVFAIGCVWLGSAPVKARLRDSTVRRSKCAELPKGLV